MGGKQGKEQGQKEDSSGAGLSPGPGVDKKKLSLAHQSLRLLPAYTTSDPQGIDTLDVSHNKLTNPMLTADNLGRFPNLITLIADDNRLSDFLNMPQMEHLTFMSLNSNQIKDVDLLCQILSSKCPKLTTLSLVNNPCYPSYEVQHRAPNAISLYRSAALRHLPKLKMLDCLSITQMDRDAAVQLSDDIAEEKIDLDVALRFDVPAPVPSQSRAELRESRAALRESKRNLQEEKKRKDKKEKKARKKQAEDKEKARRAAKRNKSSANIVGDGGEVSQPPPKEAVGHAAGDWSSSDDSESSDAELDAVLQRSQAVLPRQQAYATSSALVVPPHNPDAPPAPLPPLPPTHEATSGAVSDWSSSSSD